MGFTYDDNANHYITFYHADGSTYRLRMSSSKLFWQSRGSGETSWVEIWSK